MLAMNQNKLSQDYIIFEEKNDPLNCIALSESFRWDRDYYHKRNTAK